MAKSSYRSTRNRRIPQPGDLGGPQQRWFSLEIAWIVGADPHIDVYAYIYDPATDEKQYIEPFPIDQVWALANFQLRVNGVEQEITVVSETRANLRIEGAIAPGNNTFWVAEAQRPMTIFPGLQNNQGYSEENVV